MFFLVTWGAPVKKKPKQDNIFTIPLEQSTFSIALLSWCEMTYAYIFYTWNSISIERVAEIILMESSCNSSAWDFSFPGVIITSDVWSYVPAHNVAHHNKVKCAQESINYMLFYNYVYNYVLEKRLPNWIYSKLLKWFTGMANIQTISGITIL